MITSPGGVLSQRDTAEGMKNYNTQANVVLVCAVQEGPGNSRMSICRARFMFTLHNLRLGKGPELAWTMIPDMGIRSPGLKGDTRGGRSCVLRSFTKGSEENFWSSGRGHISHTKQNEALSPDDPSFQLCQFQEFLIQHYRRTSSNPIWICE